MPSLKNILLGSVCILWAGCNVLSESIPYENHLPNRKTTAASVEILQKYPEKTYVALGKVEAHAASMWTSWESMHDKLREEASRLGADAIVNLNPPDEPDDRVKVTGIGWVDYFFKPPRHVTAIAIRYL